MQEIYVDNAATTKLSPLAFATISEHLNSIYGNPFSLHSVGQRAAQVLEAAREIMAEHLGCQARELYFTSGGSKSDNQALITAATWGEKRGKKHIVSSAFEHHAVLHTLKKLENKVLKSLYSMFTKTV